jgi:hypothetical protein
LGMAAFMGSAAALVKQREHPALSFRRRHP